MSHLGADAHAALCDRWPSWTLPIRIGTGLWHGDKAALHLGPMCSTSTPSPPADAGYHGTR